MQIDGNRNGRLGSVRLCWGVQHRLGNSAALESRVVVAPAIYVYGNVDCLLVLVLLHRNSIEHRQ